MRRLLIAALIAMAWVGSAHGKDDIGGSILLGCVLMKLPKSWLMGLGQS